jgi:hypothetical protein
MGIVSNISGRVQKWFGTDKEAVITSLKKGDDGADIAGGNGGGLVSDWSGYDQLADSLHMEETLMYRYADYEEMDDYPEIGSALDVYADDATVQDAQHNTCIWPLSSDSLVREVLSDLLDRRLRIEEDIYALTRGLAKYGNAYAEILANENGIVGLNYLPAPSMRRIEDSKGNLIGFIQSMDGRFLLDGKQMAEDIKNKKLPQGVTFFEPYEVVHWRLQGKRVHTTYGYSILDSARWIFRRLVMAEDSALIYKLTRAPARYAFYVDTGNLPPAQRTAYVNQVKQAYKKKKLFNPSTGKLDFRMNPLASDEDFWVPTANGVDSTRIEVISGPDYQTTDDLEYFRGKLFSALKVPRRYLGFDGGESRASLSQEDVRFARTVQRLQREVRNGYKKVCRIHLAALNIDPDQIDFDLKMTTSSTVFELSQLELMNARAGTAQSLMDYMPKEWILEHIFEFSKDDALFIQKAKQTEMRDDAVFQADTDTKVMEKTGAAQLNMQAQAMEMEAAMGVPVEGEVETTIAPEKEAPAEESVAFAKMYANIDKRISALAKDAERMRRDQRDQNDSVVSLLEEVAPVIKDVHKILRRNRANASSGTTSRRRVQ